MGEVRIRPAYSRPSSAVRLDDKPPLVEQITRAWAFDGATGKGVRVAVVDSGIDADHPDLDGCVEVDAGVAVAVDENDVPVVRPGPHGDACGHGTACAGIIHALAPRARLTSVKVLGPDMAGRAGTFVAGLQWAVEQGFDVINLSLASTRREWALPFYELCDEAHHRGTIVVTASNNLPSASFPSFYASVLSVACNTSSDPLRYHHHPKPPPEFLARGIDVEVPWLDGGRTVLTGNSLAAPHISAFAALLRSKHPGLRPYQVKTVLAALAANSHDAASPQVADGRSRLLASRALRHAAR